MVNSGGKKNICEKYSIKKYGFLRYGVWDPRSNTFVKDDEGYVIVFLTKEEAKEFLNCL